MKNSEDMGATEPTIAVLLPCFNEEAAIAGVVRDFRAVLPTATIYVYDNNSTDATAAVARQAGAVVRAVQEQGKGHVVRHMFMDIEADLYLIADGDGTYDPQSAPRMIAALQENIADMVVGVRRHSSDRAYRRGHQWGNRLFNGLVYRSFGHKPGDMLSGYRLFSRRFVKSFPMLSGGFEIETEMTIHALSLQIRVVEVETPYYERTAGTTSKLRTYSDGYRILKSIVLFVKDERPFRFFLLLGVGLALLSLGFGWVVIAEYFTTHYITHVPMAILATGLMILSFLLVTVGVILDSVSRGRKEAKKIAFLQAR